jgi:hypothetical protein
MFRLASKKLRREYGQSHEPVSVMACTSRAAAGHGGFIEAEAELSDDEGLGLGGGGVSDDEEEGQGDDAMLVSIANCL